MDRFLYRSLRRARERRARGEAGFTLIELLVVIVILGIIAGIVVFSVRGLGDKGQAAAVKADAQTLRTAEETYCAKNHEYGTEQQLVSAGLLTSESTLNGIAVDDLPQVCGNSFTIFQRNPPTTSVDLPGDYQNKPAAAVAVDPSTNKAYTAADGSATIGVLVDKANKLNSITLSGPAAVFAQASTGGSAVGAVDPASFFVIPGADRLYVRSAATPGTYYVINTGNDTPVGTLTLPGGAVPLDVGQSANGSGNSAPTETDLAVDPVTHQAYLLDSAGHLDVIGVDGGGASTVAAVPGVAISLPAAALNGGKFGYTLAVNTKTHRVYVAGGWANTSAAAGTGTSAVYVVDGNADTRVAGPIYFPCNLGTVTQTSYCDTADNRNNGVVVYGMAVNLNTNQVYLVGGMYYAIGQSPPVPVYWEMDGASNSAPAAKMVTGTLAATRGAATASWVAVNPSNNKVYLECPCSSAGTNAILVADGGNFQNSNYVTGQTNSALAVVPLAGSPKALAKEFSPNLTVNTNTNQVFVISPLTNSATAGSAVNVVDDGDYQDSTLLGIPTNSNVLSMAFNPDTNTLYVADGTNGTLMVVG